MKILPLGMLALGLLTAPFAAFGDVRITSFEEGLTPWFAGSSEGGKTYTLNTTSASHGTSSAEAVIPMTAGVFETCYAAPVASYRDTVVQATGIKADVYFSWENRPGSPGGGYAGFSLNLNYQGGYVNVNPSSGGLNEGVWTTITWPLSPEQVAAITAEGLSYSNIGFLLNAGAYGGATISGTITLRIDNVVVIGAAAPSAPAAPTNVAGTGVYKGVNLTWTASTDTLFYTVKRSTTVDGIYATVADNLTTTSYGDTGLRGNTTYYYVVTASNANGESLPSAVASVATVNDEVLLTSFEEGPAPWIEGGDVGGNATAYALTTTSASQGATSAEAVLAVTGPAFARVYSAPVASYQTTIAQSTGIMADVYFEWAGRPTSPTGGTYADLRLNLSYQGGSELNLAPALGGLAEGVWQTLVWDLTPEQVAAITANGLSYSNIGFLLNSGAYANAGEGNVAPDLATAGGTITLRFDNIRTTGFLAVAVPAAPTGLAAMAGAEQVSLSWNASASATGYTVRRGTVAGGPYATTVAAGLTSTAYVDTGLTGGTTYYYVVLATNAGGDSPASAEAFATAGAGGGGIASWRQTYFGTTEATGNAANDADPDSDGVANLLEYALGGDPTVAESDLLPVQTIDAGHLELSFSRIADPSLTYSVLASDNLTAWSSVWTSTGMDNTEGVVTVTDPEALSAHTRRFLRLQVTTP